MCVEYEAEARLKKSGRRQDKMPIVCQRFSGKNGDWVKKKKRKSTEIG
jgi:hypothetical protein